MIHNTGARCQDHISKLSTRKQLHHPLLEVFELDIVSGRNDTGLVEAAVELNDDLAISVIVNFFELANVACSNRVSHFDTGTYVAVK